MEKEGSSDLKKVRKRWYFKETLTEWFFCGITVKNLLKHLYFFHHPVVFMHILKYRIRNEQCWEVTDYM